MLKCELLISDIDSMYINQIVSGFEMLQREGYLLYEVKENPNVINMPFNYNYIEILASGKRIVCDMSDGYNNYTSLKALDDVLDDVDYYFKSNISDEYNANMRNKNKFFPMPPRYDVLLPGLPLRKIKYGKILQKGGMDELKRICKKTPFFRNSECHHYIESFECSPEMHDIPKVFFYTRLWDPNIASTRSSQNIDLNGITVDDRIESKREEYNNLSNLRAELVKRLRNEFKSKFIGGIAPEEYALKTYPELIGNVDISSRKKYTDHLHMADICVNTRGTHNCWNFSFGEAVAAAKAIVTENPLYREPLHMKEDIHFITFKSVDECVERVCELFENEDKLKQMKLNNYDYYNNYLRPDYYVKNILKIAGENV